MEVSGKQVTEDRRNRRRSGGWTRIDGGSTPTTNPPLDWQLIYDRDSAGESRGLWGGVPAAVSARKLATALWQLAATTSCRGGVRWQCGLSDELGLEGSTKWDINSYSEAPAYVSHFHKHTKLLNNQDTITRYENPKKWSRTRPKHVIQKRDEEETSLSMKTQHHQIYAIIKNLKDDVRRERKACKKMYIANSKLQSDIAEAKLLAMRIMRSYEKEKKAREWLEDICHKQAKIIEAYEAQIEELRDQCARIQDEVEEEKEMLQVADSWREERAQMKLVDAKYVLEDKYREMSNLIENLKTFLRSSKFDTNVNEITNIERVEELLSMLSKFDKEFVISRNFQVGDGEDEVYHA